MATSPLPTAVRLSDRLYRLLLVAYPPAFRRDYGWSMAQVFRDCCREAARRGGMRAIVALWLLTLRDLARTACVERVMEVLQMSGMQWIRWSGLAAILGGALWMVGLPGLGDKLPGISHAGGHIILAVSALFILFGLAGVYARYAARGGRASKTGLGLGLLGAALVTIGNGLEGLFTLEIGWGLFMVGLLTLLIGMMVFSVAALRQRLLPRWNTWPFITSTLGLLVSFLASMIFNLNLDTTANADVLAFAGMVGFGLGWMALGYTLWSGAEEPAGAPPLAAA